MKNCCTCKIAKEISEFHSGAKCCKPCANIAAKNSYIKNKEKISLEAKDPASKAHTNALRRARYAKNPSVIDARNKAWKNKNSEKVALSISNWQKKNPEKCCNNTKKWVQANKGIVNARTRAYQLAKINRTPAWLTAIDYERIQNEYKLAEILRKLTNQQWHVDHIIPLQGKIVSGLHVPSNLRVVVAKENIAKSNKFEVTL